MSSRLQVRQHLTLSCRTFKRDACRRLALCRSLNTHNTFIYEPLSAQASNNLQVFSPVGCDGQQSVSLDLEQSEGRGQVRRGYSSPVTRWSLLTGFMVSVLTPTKTQRNRILILIHLRRFLRQVLVWAWERDAALPQLVSAT